MNAYRKAEKSTARVYLGTANTVVCLDRYTGNELWRTPLSAGFGQKDVALLVHGGKVFVGGFLVAACFRAADGAELWSVSTDVRGPIRLALDATIDPALLLVAGEGSICAVDASTGKRVWRNGLSGLGFHPITMSAPGTINASTASAEEPE